jgi:hypothetical protein
MSYTDLAGGGPGHALHVYYNKTSKGAQQLTNGVMFDLAANYFPLGFGYNSSTTPTNFFKGFIYEMRWYNITRSQANINAMLSTSCTAIDSSCSICHSASASASRANKCLSN